MLAASYRHQYRNEAGVIAVRVVATNMSELLSELLKEVRLGEVESKNAPFYDRYKCKLGSDQAACIAAEHT